MKARKIPTVLVLALGLAVSLGQPAISGEIMGWGMNTYGQADPCEGDDFVAVAAGGGHGLALESDGSIVAWGANDFGQLNVPAGNDFVAIAAGASHSLALKSDGSIMGWGSNFYSEAMPPPGNDFVAIAADGWHSLALKSDGTIVGWGSNSYGEATPPAGNDFVAVDAGYYHSLALRTDGTLATWGVSDGGAEDYGQVTGTPGGNDYVAIAAGRYHNLALKSDGSIAGWGCNDCTDGPWCGQATPPPGNDHVAIAAGGYHSLALKSDGSIAGWGENYSGQATPPPGSDYVAIAAGAYYSLGLEATPMGTAFTYQGRLTDSNRPADGLYDFQFKIHTEAGFQQGDTVEVDDVDVVDGYFAVELDFGSDANIFKGYAHGLEIAVRPGDSNDVNDFVVLSPTQQVTPVPYAQTATAALRLRPGGSETDAVYVDPNGNVGIGTTSPNAYLDISPSPGTAGKEIFRAFSPADADYITSDVAVIQGGPTSDYTGTILKVQSRKGDNTEYALMNVRNAVETAPSSKFYIRGDGHVGIGTTSPAGKLHIVDSSAGLTVPLFLSNEGTTNGNSAMLLFRSKDTAGFQQNFAGIKTAYLSHAAGAIEGRLDFHVSDPSGSIVGPRVSISQSGNVGIGKDSPAEKLHVAGDIRLDAGGDIAFGDDFTRIYESTDDLFLTAHDDIYIDGSTLFVDNGQNRVGIGTTTPAVKLEVVGDVNAYRYYDRQDSSYYLDPASTSRLNSLNVQSTVHMYGAVYMHGAVYMPQVYNHQVSDSRSLHIVSGGRVGYNILSSKRYKENIDPLEDDFSKILSARPVTFTWKKSGEPGIGLIAEDLDELGLRNLVIYDAEGRPDGVRYEFISLYLLEVVKELKAENEALREQLKTQNQSLKQRLDALEKTIRQLAERKLFSHTKT